MMVLHPSGTDPPPGRTAAMQKVRPSLRRRSTTKGTIAGFAFGKADAGGAAAAEQLNGELPENFSGSQAPSSASISSSQPQHPPDTSPSPAAKPCHASRVALLSAQNAIRMGALTQLNLCPPGRARRELQAALRQRSRTQQNMLNRRLMVNLENGGYYSLDRMLGVESLEDYEAREEEFLISADAFGVESDEEVSSGDEDDLCEIEQLFSEESPSLDDEDKYLNLREPLFTPAGAESALSSPSGAPMTSIGSGASGKLPFNRRKIRYFDTVTAADCALARSYLQQEDKRAKQRAALLLSRHLRRVQQKERRRVRLEKGESTEDLSEAENESPEQRALVTGGISQLPSPISASFAAALLLESLSINPLESLEGMAKCYDGIVAAGVALLDAQTIDPTSPQVDEGKSRPTRSEIMAALDPLLITSLEQPSGEAILMLAKLRRMCATSRYQRRFVQRVAPALIRPPRGAMWCLRHQNDMEAILAAAELILDSAFDIFSKGWYERGRLLLADSKRAETLNTAAKQLRNLSSEPSDGLVLGLSSHGNRRRLITSAKKKTDVSGAASEPLAEWEVIAVDRQIRVSISNVMSTDWSRTAIQSEVPRPYRRTVGVTTKRPTIAILPQASSSEASPKSLVSPRSPSRTLTVKAPVSPPPMLTTAVSSNATENIENVFGPSFSADRPLSPPPPSAAPISPPLANRTGSKDYESKPELVVETSQTPYSVSTPPRSPRSPTRPQLDGFKNSDSLPSLAPLSPKRGKVAPTSKDTLSVPSQASQSVTSTPLSPSSVGTSGSGEIVSYRPSANSAPTVLSSSGATSHYRMLTSTAAERKRTVAACRALRAQIQRFEDAFIQLHGRPPKGASERAPLATTYAQYREWKRAIRADAACRIQALFRGARTRWMLLRSNNPEITRVIMTRAGRSGYTGSEGVIKQLSIPAEIGQDSERGTLSPHQWPVKPVRRRANSGDRPSEGSFPSPPTSKPFAAPPVSPPPTHSPSELSNLSLPELQARKRDLKQQLKQYDMNFARKHCRMPVKAEKEPIRHLYESYNALKKQISVLEQEGRQSPSPVSQPQAGLTQRNSSPSSGSESGNSASDDSPMKTSPLPTRTKRKMPKPSSPPISTTSTPSGAPSQDLAQLKSEKAQLHQMLRSYEKDFFKEHKRQVSSFADIKPVASQYRRYKEIKKAILALQQGGEK